PGAERIVEGGASTDLTDNGGAAEQSFESVWARYLSQQPNKATGATAPRQPNYLLVDAIDEKSDKKADTQAKKNGNSPNAASTGAQRSAQDEAKISSGRGYFESSCTQCHDAERATSKRKSYSAWLSTVQRMAAKEGADIPSSQYADIATYLASLNPANGAA